MTVIDASIAVKWFVAEELHHEARALLDRRADRLLAPDLLPIEVANVAWKKVRLEELLAAEAARLVSALLGGIPALHPSAPLLPRATELAVSLDHPVYDCLYLALALREDVALVTADRRFHEAVATSAHAGATALLGGQAHRESRS